MTTQNPSTVSGGKTADVSIFGSHDTFGLTRRCEKGDPTIALYELLPENQAQARKQRLERTGRSLSTTALENVFTVGEHVDGEESWERWTAVEIATLRGSRLSSVLSIIRETLEKTDIDHAPITTTQGGEVFVPESVGVKLALAFVGIEELRRVDRMRGLVRGVARMSTEECYYWYAKCRSPKSPNGVKALRTLLTNHIE